VNKTIGTKHSVSLLTYKRNIYILKFKMVEYIMKKGNLRDISCKMLDAGFDVSFWDFPAKGGTSGHPINRAADLSVSSNSGKFNGHKCCQLPSFFNLRGVSMF
jgi:hypothetical protein